MATNRDKIAGRVKQAAGDLTGIEELEREGERQEFAGDAKEQVDKAADKVNKAIGDVKDKINKKLG